MSYKKTYRAKTFSYKAPIIEDETIDEIHRQVQIIDQKETVNTLKPWHYSIDTIQDLITNSIKKGQTVSTITLVPEALSQSTNWITATTATIVFWKKGKLKKVYVSRSPIRANNITSKVTFHEPKKTIIKL